MKMACVQMEAPELADFESTFNRIQELLGRALEPGVDLVVFPECAWPAYFLDPAEKRILEKALSLNDRLIEHIRRQARKHSSFVAFGLVEEKGENLGNNAILVDPSGEIVLRVSKMNLWHFDRDLYESGRSFGLVDSPFGRIGLLICADARLPEIARVLSVMGADLIIDPANLTGYSFSPGNLSNPQLDFMLPARSFENGVWWVLSNKCGIESGTVPYVGGSRVISPEGVSIASARRDREEIVFVDIDLPGKRPEPHPERVPEMYGVLGEPTEDLPVTRIISESAIPSCNSFFLGAAQFGARNVEEYIVKAGKYLGNLGRLHASVVALPPADFPTGTDVHELAEMITERYAAAIGEMIVALAGSERSGEPLGVLFGSGKILASARGCHGPGRSRRAPLSATDITRTSYGNFAFVQDGEILLPECSRSLTLLGADLLLSLTAFDSGPSLEIARTRAYENKVFLVRTAPPGGNRRSFICDPYGRILAGAFEGREQAFGCQVELLSARCKEVVPGTDVIRGRNPSDYGLLCR